MSDTPQLPPEREERHTQLPVEQDERHGQPPPEQDYIDTQPLCPSLLTICCRLATVFSVCIPAACLSFTPDEINQLEFLLWSLSRLCLFPVKLVTPAMIACTANKTGHLILLIAQLTGPRRETRMGVKVAELRKFFQQWLGNECTFDDGGVLHLSSVAAWSDNMVAGTIVVIFWILVRMGICFVPGMVLTSVTGGSLIDIDSDDTLQLRKEVCVSVEKPVTVETPDGKTATIRKTHVESAHGLVRESIALNIFMPLLQHILSDSVNLCPAVSFMLCRIMRYCTESVQPSLACPFFVFGMKTFLHFRKRDHFAIRIGRKLDMNPLAISELIQNSMLYGLYTVREHFGENPRTIDCRGLRSGFYLYLMVPGKGRDATQLVIVPWGDIFIRGQREQQAQESRPLWHPRRSYQDPVPEVST